jgi:hypothetical protein
MKTQLVQRYLSPEIIRFLAEERKMAFIAGPRQVGKTTLAKALLSAAGSDSLYFNWDIESHRKNILRHPEEFWHRTAPVLPPGVRPRVVLDEIHKYPRWKRFLKGLSDAEGKQLEVIVTGSGRLDYFQRGGDSLVGRYHLYHLFPFTVGELIASDRRTVTPPAEFWESLRDRRADGEAVEALRSIEHLTGFPEPLFDGRQVALRRWRQGHQRLVVREDLRDLTRIREIGLVESLLLLLPERVGSPLSVNALAEDLAVTYPTVLNWLRALERLYVLFTIRPYAGRLARTLRREEKAYLFDHTLIEKDGARFENLVALHLLKLCHAWTEWGFGEYALHYVRDREKREVDFLITESRKPYALVEAKLSASDPDPSLLYFAERLRPAHVIQVVRQPKGFDAVFPSRKSMMVPAAALLSLI